MVQNNSQSLSDLRQRFGTDIDVEALTGISHRTLRKDRLVGRIRFPWYKVGRRVLYDLEEVRRSSAAQSTAGKQHEQNQKARRALERWAGQLF